MGGFRALGGDRPGLQARDVVAFGHETGRALSDGRIVGRAEPFAKVFPSSREVKRAVGLLAWAILEDIALDARLDDAGRLVSTTNVRRIAANLGINKDTAAKHLARLRDFGFVLQEEGRQGPSGRWEACRYVLDPSACLERFTHTPPSTSRGRASSPSGPGEANREPCPKNSDTAAAPAASRSNATVSERAGHGGTGRGELGHHREEVVAGEQQQPVRSDDAVGQLVDLGIAADRAMLLVDDWDLGSDESEDRERVRCRATRRVAETRRHLDEVCDQAEGQRRGTGWASALDGALDDGLLGEAIDAVAARLPATVRRSVPIVRAHLLALAVEACRSYPQVPAQVALRRHLRDPGIALAATGRYGLAPPPADHPPGDPSRFAARIAVALARRATSCQPPRPTHRTREDQR
jgi:hypothetical protein